MLYSSSRMSPSEEDREKLGAGQWAISKRLVSTRYSAAGKSGKRPADELLITTLPPSSLETDVRLRRI
jgi:DNA adenine methylase